MTIHSQGSINKVFENTFPSIAEEENRYEKDLLADGRFVADGKRRLNQAALLDNIRGETDNINANKIKTLKELLEIRYIYEIDEKTGEILYFMPEEDKNGKTIIDKENKIIKFIDSKTGKIKLENFVENDL